jgi:hypothetical protein
MTLFGAPATKRSTRLYASATRNAAAPATSMCVRKPAGLFAASRSRPITPPRGLPSALEALRRLATCRHDGVRTSRCVPYRQGIWPASCRGVAGSFRWNVKS